MFEDLNITLTVLLFLWCFGLGAIVIEIEGGYGWAERLPTWYLKRGRTLAELAARAGYNPHAAVSLWEKMERVAGGDVPQWLSTHPSHSSRIAELRTYADRVQPLYQSARK